MSNYRRGGVLPAGAAGAAEGSARPAAPAAPRPSPSSLGTAPAPSGTAACPVLMAGTARSPEAGGMLQRIPVPEHPTRRCVAKVTHHILGFPTGAGLQELLSWLTAPPRPRTRHSSVPLSSEVWEASPAPEGCSGGAGAVVPTCGVAARHARLRHTPESKARTPPRPIPPPGPAVAAPLPRRHSARNALLLSGGPQSRSGVPEEGAEQRELFSRSHFIVVAKETSSRDLAWNMSASAGPHIHLTETALKAGAGADKGRDGGGRLRGGHRRGGSATGTRPRFEPRPGARGGPATPAS